MSSCPTSPSSSSDPSLPWATKAGATLLLRVRLTPKSSRDRIGGIIETPEGPAIQAHVRALPQDGEANTALIALVAKWLGVPKSSIELASGGKSRVKTLALSEPDPQSLAAQLETWAAKAPETTR